MHTSRASRKELGEAANAGSCTSRNSDCIGSLRTPFSVGTEKNGKKTRTTMVNTKGKQRERESRSCFLDRKIGSQRSHFSRGLRPAPLTRARQFHSASIAADSVWRHHGVRYEFGPNARPHSVVRLKGKKYVLPYFQRRAEPGECHHAFSAANVFFIVAPGTRISGTCPIALAVIRWILETLSLPLVFPRQQSLVLGLQRVVSVTGF